MKRKARKIIIDTNLWISFLISKKFSQLDEIIFTYKCQLIFSDELMDEFLLVVKRPKLRRFFSKDDLLELIETIQTHADFIEVKSHVTECRDLKDNFLLELAKDAKADFLITGDKDLLELNPFEKTRIVTITEFFEQIK